MKIPTYESTNGIKTGSIPTMGQESVNASRQAQAGLSEAIKKVGQDFADVEQARQKVRDFRQTTESSAMGLDRLNSTYAAWEQDKENLDPQSYLDGLDKIGPEVTKNISSGLVKEQFMADFNKQVEATKWKIRSSLNKREIDTASGTLEYQGQQIIDNPPADLHDPLQNTTLMNYRQQYDKAIQLGLFTRDEANYKWGEFLKKVATGKVEYDIANDNSTQEKASVTISEIKKGSEGIYDFLTSEQRTDLLKKAQSRVFQNNQSFKRNVEIEQNKRSDDLIKKLSEGTLTLKDIDNEEVVPEAEGGLKKKTLLAYRNTLQTDIKDSLKTMLSEKTNDNEPTGRAQKIKKYLATINSNTKNEMDRWTERERLAEAYRDGVIDKEELKFLYELKGEARNPNNIFAKTAGIAINTLNSFLQSVGANPVDMAINMSELIGKMAKNKNITTKEVNDMQQRYINEKVPEASTLGSSGGYFKDYDGTLFRLVPSPDGGVERKVIPKKENGQNRPK